MDPTEYQVSASRTECDQKRSLTRINDCSVFERTGWPDLASVRLIHGVLGLTGETGELASAVEKWLYYGHELDETNIKEEVGDCLWYLALICNALRLDLDGIMDANIAKLKKRYPEKFCQDRAKEENRDRAAEAKVVDNVIPCPDSYMVNGAGFAEPPEDEEPLNLVGIVGIGFNLAREMVKCFAMGQDQPRALKRIDEAQAELLRRLQ